MKRTLNVNLGKMSFVIDEDAFNTLDRYYVDIRSRLSDAERQEVMDDVEARTADIFGDSLSFPSQVVDILLVRKAISIIGSAESFGEKYYDTPASDEYVYPKEKRLYRSRTNRALGGVCGGLADYLNMDTTIMRVLMVLLVVCGTLGIWVYIILWIVIPEEPIEDVRNSYRRSKRAYHDDYHRRKYERR